MTSTATCWARRLVATPALRSWRSGSARTTSTNSVSTRGATTSTSRRPWLAFARHLRPAFAHAPQEYVIGLQWVLKYYYHGVASWSWLAAASTASRPPASRRFFPSHYAPMVSDLVGLADFVPEFNLGHPFHPFEQVRARGLLLQLSVVWQLLSVLPAASKDLLPQPYHDLMTNPSSPIIGFYPSEFRTDLNGKKAEWESVVLIPFIDQVSCAAHTPRELMSWQDLLLQAMAPIEKLLSADEKHRNAFNVSRAYQFDAAQTSSYKAPSPAVADVVPCRVRSTALSQPHCKPGRAHKGLCADIDLQRVRPGFPSFRCLPYTSELKEASVIVFDMPSRNPSMVVSLTPERSAAGTDLLQSNSERSVAHGQLGRLAAELVGTTCFVGWPRLVQARIMAVSTEREVYSIAAKPGLPPVLYKNTKPDADNWHALVKNERER